MPGSTTSPSAPASSCGSRQKAAQKGRGVGAENPCPKALLAQTLGDPASLPRDMVSTAGGGVTSSSAWPCPWLSAWRRPWSSCPIHIHNDCTPSRHLSKEDPCCQDCLPFFYRLLGRRHFNPPLGHNQNLSSRQDAKNGGRTTEGRRRRTPESLALPKIRILGSHTKPEGHEVREAFPYPSSLCLGAFV